MGKGYRIKYKVGIGPFFGSENTLFKSSLLKENFYPASYSDFEINTVNNLPECFDGSKTDLFSFEGKRRQFQMNK